MACYTILLFYSSFQDVVLRSGVVVRASWLHCYAFLAFLGETSTWSVPVLDC